MQDTNFITQPIYEMVKIGTVERLESELAALRDQYDVRGRENEQLNRAGITLVDKLNDSRADAARLRAALAESTATIRQFADRSMYLGLTSWGSEAWLCGFCKAYSYENLEGDVRDDGLIQYTPPEIHHATTCLLREMLDRATRYAALTSSSARRASDSAAAVGGEASGGG